MTAKNHRPQIPESAAGAFNLVCVALSGDVNSEKETIELAAETA